MITPINPFRPLVWHGEFDFSKLNLMNKLEQAVGISGDPYLREPNFSTTPAEIQPHTWPELRPYIDYINNIAEKIAESWELFPLQRFIASSHVNKIIKGKGLREHAHPGVDMVVTGYISAPVGGGNIEIRDPMEYQWQNLPINPQPYQIWKEIPVKTNSVLVFPGFVNHKTQPSITDEPRWAISLMIKTRMAPL
jgi:hypothetical protein